MWWFSVKHRANGSCFGDDIQVTVLSIRGRHVKLGISDPADVPIHREEVYRRLQYDSGIGANAPPPVPVTTQPVPPVMAAR